jgi:hypothetical protein
MRLPLLAILIAALLPIVATAQTTKPDPATSHSGSLAEQEELRFEESIRNFGFVSGAAYQCLPESDRIAHDREVLKAYSGLVRLFGSDRAFFYAAAFGAGTSMSLDKTKCAGYVEDFKASMKSSARGQ